LQEYKDALAKNYGKDRDAKEAERITAQVARQLVQSGRTLTADDVKTIYATVVKNPCTDEEKARYGRLLDRIKALPKFGNDIDEVDDFARDVAYTYTRPLLNYRNPRGGQFQAGLYPVSANVPLGAQTGATPDGRYAGFPLGDGSGPCQGREMSGPTASILSSTKWAHSELIGGIAVNMKFSKSSLGDSSIETMKSLIKAFILRGGFEIQINVTDRSLLLEARQNPEEHRDLVVRIGGYSDYFTRLSPQMQDEVILRTEHKI
jgi:formate C-acetyltransferase